MLFQLVAGAYSYGTALLPTQNTNSDLAVKTLIGPRHVAPAEPDPNRAVGHLLHAGVAHHLAVPCVRSGDDEVRDAFPADTVGGTGQAQTALFLLIPARVKHPPLAA